MGGGEERRPWPQAPDHLHDGKLYATAVAALALGAAAVVASSLMLPSQPGPRAEVERSEAAPHGAIDAVRQTPFDDRGAPPRIIAGDETILLTYGWVDEDAGIARIPIERMLEILAEEEVRTAKEDESRSMEQQREPSLPVDEPAERSLGRR